MANRPFLAALLMASLASAQQPVQSATSPQTQTASTAPIPTPPSSNKVVLEDGTPVRLRLGRTVSSADAHVGDTVDFDVLDEIKVGDLVVVPKGSTAWATVTEAEHKRRMGRGGKLNMNIDSVRLADGEKAALRAVKGGEGGGHVGAMTGGIVATALIVWPAAPFFLFMHGKDVSIPKGTEITAYINGNFNADAAKFQPPPVPVVATAPAAPTLIAIQVSSTPSAADIIVDGNFVGSTPSTVQLAAGDHTVSVKKTGFSIWERQLKVNGGSIKIEADLQAIEASQPSQ